MLPESWQDALRERFKRVLVRTLLRAADPIPLRLNRRVVFGTDQVEVEDLIEADAAVRLSRLECGRAFVGLHMASARYFPGFADGRASLTPVPIDPAPLAGGNAVRHRRVVA